MYTPNLQDIGQFNVADARDFVDFWGQPANAGSQKNEKRKPSAIDYFAELNLGSELTEQNIRRLLQWKDPRWLTDPRKGGEANPNVATAIRSLNAINQFRNDRIAEDEMRREADQVFPSGGVWKFFLLHIAKPHIYPIADENVFRVWSLHTKVPAGSPYSWATYGAYCEYFERIAATLGVERTNDNIRELKRIDNALVRFGQFLRSYCPGLVLKPAAANASVAHVPDQRAAETISA